MQTLALSEAKDQLSRLVEQVEREHESIVITRHGRAAAALMSKDSLDALHETLFWLSQPGTGEDISGAHRQQADGGLRNAAETMERFGVQPR